jgi:hypothetical protein
MIETKLGAEARANIYVNYESSTTVLLIGNLLSGEEYSATFNTWLWKLTDLLRSNGFQIEQVITSGIGSVGNN